MINIKDIVDLLSDKKTPEGTGIAIQIIDDKFVLTPLFESDLVTIKQRHKQDGQFLKDAEKYLSEQQEHVNKISENIDFVKSVNCIDVNPANFQEVHK